MIIECRCGTCYLEELLYEAILSGAPPDDCIIWVWQQEADGHDSQIVLNVHRRPAQVAPMDLLIFQAHQLGHARPTDVYVQQTHLCRRSSSKEG